MVTSDSGFVKISPLNNAPMGDVNSASSEHIHSVVAVARQAFEGWRNTPIEQRGRIIRRASQDLEERADEVAALVREETGKPTLTSLGEVAAASEMGFLISSLGRHPYGTLVPSAVANRQIRVERIPLGVAALIVSYNTPLPNYAWKVFPALMAGNTAILKPSPHTPLSAQLFFEILHDAGIPRDVFHIVQGGAEVAQTLISAGVDLVSFTGSYGAGYEVAQSAAQTLTKTILELGGSNPMIVCADSDLDKAAAAALDSAFSNAGQRCASASRLLIEDSIYEEFRRALVHQANKLVWGTDDTVDVSTLIDTDSADAHRDFLRQCERSGALVTLVGAPDPSGESSAASVQPALIEGLDPRSALATREIFAPATRLFRFSSAEEAIDIANSSEFGLTAAVWSSNIAMAERIVAKLQAGVVNINGPTHGAEINIPFGGLKNSGNGTRDAGVNAVDQYSEVHVVSTFFGA